MTRATASLVPPDVVGASRGFEWVFVDGDFHLSDDVRLSVKAHAVSYGTGTFEGIRATWNEERDELYLLEPLAHFERLRLSAEALALPFPYSPGELVEATRVLLRKNGAQEDSYVRPLVLLTGELLQVRMHDIQAQTVIYACPFPAGYVPTSGVRCLVSSWRRVPDTALPVRAKVTGSYVNPALAKTEAIQAGADEAIILTVEGNVCEASTSNIFLRRGETWVTPAVTEDILEGITRRQTIELIQERLEEPVFERVVDRSELYVCDEALLCGTAVRIAPLIEVDRRPVGDGRPGTRTLALMETLTAIERGEHELHAEWITPVYGET